MTRPRARTRPPLVAGATLLLTIVACGPGDDVDGLSASAISLSVPRALLECAAPPADLTARLWVSGSAEPCALEVDVDANVTTGACETRPGLVRTLTVDWFVPSGAVANDNGDDIELVLAQARGALDLTKGDAAEAAFTVAEEDVVTSECLDMRDDQVDGSPIIEVNGAGVPVCDVDDSCAGGDGACTNLGELCAGTNPFDAEDEP